MVAKVVHLRSRPRLLLTSAVASWWGRSTSAWGSPLKTPDLMRSHHLSRRGSGSKTRLHYIRPYSSSFPTVQVYINSEFPVLTDSIKYISQECRQEAKEQIVSWRDLKGLTDIDLIHSKLIYIVQGRVKGIKNNSIQFKCTYTHIAKYFLRKCHTWSWAWYKE